MLSLNPMTLELMMSPNFAERLGVRLSSTAFGVPSRRTRSHVGVPRSRGQLHSQPSTPNSQLSTLNFPMNPTELQNYLSIARFSGCPADQMENFASSEIWLQPKQLGASAAA